MKTLPITIEATLTRAEREAPFKMEMPSADNDPLPRITRCALEIIEGSHVLSYVERALPTGEIIETGVLAQIVSTNAAA